MIKTEKDDPYCVHAKTFTESAEFRYKSGFMKKAKTISYCQKCRPSLGRYLL